MAYAICPGCSEELRVRGRVRLGRRVYCPTCEEDLEIIETDPIELDFCFGSAEEADVDTFSPRLTRAKRPVAFDEDQEGDGLPVERFVAALVDDDDELDGDDELDDELDDDDDLYDDDDAWVGDRRFAMRG